MSGCVLNIILDPIFILPWGLNMGAAGAGLATFLSNCVACGYFFVLERVKRGKTFVCLDIRKLKNLTKEVVFGILGVGIPAVISLYFDWFGSFIQAFIFCMLTMIFIATAED
jgi:Na+-driven multidrug efflux pump